MVYFNSLACFKPEIWNNYYEISQHDIIQNETVNDKV